MQNFYIDTLDQNLQIHSNTGQVQFWLQTPIEGLDFADVRTVSYNNAGEDGGTVSNSLYGTRGISLKGVFVGSTLQQYEDNRKLLAQALAVRRSSTGVPTPIRCQFTTLAGSQYFFDAYLARKPIFDWDNIKWGRFMVQLIVPNNLIFTAGQKSSGQIVAPTSGGTTLPWTLPVTLGGGGGGKGYAINNGNGVSLPHLVLTGPLTSPLVLNSRVGIYIKLDYTIANGDYVDIYMSKPKRILLNGSSPLIGTKAVGSDWWGLEPGINPIELQTNDSSDTGNVEVLYYDASIGV